MLQGINGLSFLALLLFGCGGNQVLDKAPAPKPTVNKVSVAPIPTKPIPAASVTKGLTLSTEPTKIPIAKGRVDPFGAISVAPLKITQPQAQASKPQQQAQASKPQQAKPQQQAQASKPQQAKPQQQAQASKPQDKKIIGSASKPASPIKPNPSQNLPVLPPAPPSVEIAQAVQVKGVVELGGKVSAIVKESELSDSRSVSAGDYVAQGKVLVKRIEFNSNREPVVILEQNGVEVLKQV